MNVKSLRKYTALAMGASLTQRRVQSRVEDSFRENPLIHVRHNVIRSLFGKGGRPMEELLAEAADSRARIIMLIAGVEEKGDVSKHALPIWYGLTQRDDYMVTGLQMAFAKMESSEEGRQAMKAAGFDQLRETQLEFALDNPVREATLEEYEKVILAKVQERLYPDIPTDVSIVTNANVSDLLQAIAQGGQATTLVAHTHSNYKVLGMTGDYVVKDEIPIPEEPLRALLVHGCGGGEPEGEKKHILDPHLATEIYAPDGCPTMNHFIRGPFIRG